MREFIFKKAKAPEVALSQEVLQEMQQKAKNRLKAIQAKQKAGKASLSEDHLLKLCSEKKQSLICYFIILDLLIFEYFFKLNILTIVSDLIEDIENDYL